MDAKTIVVSVVSIAIACLFAVTVLIPVISESTAETDTFTNEGYFKVNKITDGNLSFSWDYDNPDKFIVNGDTVTFSNTDNIHVSVILADPFIVRVSPNNVTLYSNITGVGNVTADSTNKTLTLTLEDGDGTITNGVSTYSITGASTIYAISNSGDFVMKKANESAYVLEDSEIYARGMTVLSGPKYLSTKITGTPVDPQVESVSSAFTIKADSTIVTSTPVSEYVDCLKLDSIKFVAVYSDNTEYDITYSYFVVPYEVTAERSIHPDANTTALLNLIPLFVVMGIILGAVGLIAYRRL